MIMSKASVFRVITIMLSRYVIVHKFLICILTSSLGKEHWLGLDNIYELANSGNKKMLKIYLERFDGASGTAHYSTFYLQDKV